MRVSPPNIRALDVRDQSSPSTLENDTLFVSELLLYTCISRRFIMFDKLRKLFEMQLTN